MLAGLLIVLKTVSLKERDEPVKLSRVRLADSKSTLDTRQYLKEIQASCESNAKTTDGSANRSESGNPTENKTSDVLNICHVSRKDEH